MATELYLRHKRILERLEKEHEVDVKELSKEFGVSLVTIRKDLQTLEDNNLLYRAHGKAFKVNIYVGERSVLLKDKINVVEKEKIANKALEYVHPKDNILLASGTTIQYFAEKLKTCKFPIRVLSASLKSSICLAQNLNIDVIQLGGNVRASSFSIIGGINDGNLSDLNFSTLFLGVDGIDPKYGFTTSNTFEATLNKEMIERSKTIIVLADSTKIGLRGFGKICDISDVDVVITDKLVSEESILDFNNQGVEVIVA